MFEDMGDEEAAIFRMLEETGAIELYGMSGDDVTYRVNMEVLEEILPQLYQSIMDEIDTGLLEMYKAGFVDIEYDENLEAHFHINEKGKEFIRSVKEQEND
jgi:predicted transcriptional regulator